MTPWTAARPASLSFTMSQSFLKLMSIESVMPFNPLILCHILLLLPSIFPSTRVFSSELALHIRWPKYWNINFSISLPNECSGLISFRIDWFDFGFFILVFSIFLSTYKSFKPLSYLLSYVHLYSIMFLYQSLILCIMYFFSSG